MADPIPRNVNELIQQGFIYLDPESMEPYSGEVLELHTGDPPRVSLRFTVKDGVKNGPYEKYRSDGVLLEKGNRRYSIDNAPTGWFETYGDYGQLESKGTNKDGQMHGLRERYYVDGQLQDKMTYKDGQDDGPYEGYYENGQLSDKGSYKDGQADGSYERYDENGQLLEKGTFRDSKKCGEWIEKGETVTYDPCPPGLEDGN